MIAEAGHFVLILAALLALCQGTLALAGASRGRADWMAMATPLAAAQALCVLLAWASLVLAFLHNDFSVRNVAENSNSQLPVAYRFAASWGSHEGSLLLWAVLQSAWTLALLRWNAGLDTVMRARVLGVLGLLAAGFLSFVLVASNPFLRVFPVPAQGRDLNPLLQDPGMVLHPPLLYMGYVGFGVVFAFAMAALLGGAAGRGWAVAARPWATLAWCCLTAGVALGSWWAYGELGWGGWWFWDPVENAAFMPWLVGTALVHALAVSARRGAFSVWAVLLAIGCFALSLLGTFLVRSGVLSSVHAFALDPRRGVLILVLLALVVGAALVLFALRAPALVSPHRAPAPALRERLLLVHTALLSVAAASVLLGTLYPLLFEVMGLGRLSVGPPYFEAVIVPLLVAVLFLMGAAPLAQWQGATLPGLWTRLRWALALAVVLGVALAVPGVGGSAMTALGLALAAWVALVAGVAVRQRPRRGVGAWGMLLAHLGVAVFVTGVTWVRSHQSEADVRMAPGDTAWLAGHAFTFQGVMQHAGPNYQATRATVAVARDGRHLPPLQPEKRRYYATPQLAMTEAAIASGWLGDLYVTLGDDLGQGVWTLRLQHKPLVGWIWGGCALMAGGGLLAVAGRRAQRRGLQPVAARHTSPA